MMVLQFKITVCYYLWENMVAFLMLTAKIARLQNSDRQEFRIESSSSIGRSN
jgi:hypothetical protein